MKNLLPVIISNLNCKYALEKEEILESGEYITVWFKGRNLQKIAMELNTKYKHLGWIYVVITKQPYQRLGIVILQEIR